MYVYACSELCWHGNICSIFGCTKQTHMTQHTVLLFASKAQRDTATRHILTVIDVVKFTMTSDIQADTQIFHPVKHSKLKYKDNKTRE